MMDEFEDDSLPTILRKTTEDKLAYKLEIADAIRMCRRFRGTMMFPYMVKSLEEIISFDVTGYKLRTGLEKIKIELANSQKEYIKLKKLKKGKYFYKNSEQAKLKINVKEWYWSTYFMEIIQLLADYNLLFDKDKTVSVRKTHE